MIMLHFELYEYDLAIAPYEMRESVWWRPDEEQPKFLRNPTELLLQLKETAHDR